MTAGERLHAGVSELSGMSNAHAVEREHPGIAGLLDELHRETAGDRRDLIWALAELGTAVNMTSLEAVAARGLEGVPRGKGKVDGPWDIGRWTGSSRN